MRSILTLLIVLVSSVAALAQTAEVIGEGSSKYIKGFTSRGQLASDSAFIWIQNGAKGYTPEAGAVQALKDAKDSIHILAFGGTWCADTRYVLPRFYAITDAAGFSPERITLIGVDSSKKTIHHLTETFNVTLVPTLIVFRNGVEVGRVEEYGKKGQFDKELGEIIAASGKR